MQTLFCLGLGYCARHLVAGLDRTRWRITATARSPDRADALRAEGIAAVVFDGSASAPGVGEHLATATHMLVSAPPGPDGDPLLARHAIDVAAAPRLQWIGYLSTIGVYGDHAGCWVDEDTPTLPLNERSQRRVEAERHWRDVCTGSSRRLQILRLGGIYGPGRGAIDNLRRGRAHRIIKPGQVFNRIHVADIAMVLRAGMSGVGACDAYNVVDDEPAPPQDVVTFAANLIGVAPPPEVSIDSAAISPMARSFYGDNKRVSNAKLKQAFGVTLAYPTYREGLRGILEAERLGMP